ERRQPANDLPDQRHPLRKPALYPRPPGALHTGDKRSGTGGGGGLGRPDQRGLPAGVRDRRRVRAALRLPERDGHPRQPRLAQRRLRPLRAALRGAVLLHRVRRRGHGRHRLVRAGPQRWEGGARALRVYPRVLRERRGEAQDIRDPSPPHPDPGHGPRAQHHFRCGRRARASRRGGRGPRPFGPQARPVLLEAGRLLYSERRHRLYDPPARQHAALLQRYRNRRRARKGLPQVPVQATGTHRGLRLDHPRVRAPRGEDRRRSGRGPGGRARRRV
ncbi:MAG: 3',5'-cyclic-nucleotide phosphodiesterase, partial [uncultured Rubrobacteraceae bacterium]